MSDHAPPPVQIGNGVTGGPESVLEMDERPIVSPHVGHPRCASRSRALLPSASALLLLESFAPYCKRHRMRKRHRILQQASDHTEEVWILQLDKPSHRAVADLQLIRTRAVLTAVFPPKGLILHTSSCWSDAKWVAVPSKYAAQIWKFQQQEICNRTGQSRWETWPRTQIYP